jgi:FtsH-binding integral membrane protein
MNRSLAFLLTFGLAVVVAVLFFVSVMLLDSQPELITLLALAALAALFGLVRFYGWLCRRGHQPWAVRP